MFIQEYKMESKSDSDLFERNLNSDKQHCHELISSYQESASSALEGLTSLASDHGTRTSDIDGGLARFMDVDLVEDVSSGIIYSDNMFIHSIWTPSNYLFIY